MNIHAQKILILDFGSQYTQLIARRVRELGVYCELHPFDMSEAEIKAFAPNGIILSGGPESVTESTTPRAADGVFTLGVPVLGICYGLQTMAAQLGGAVDSSAKKEFGHATLHIEPSNVLFAGLAAQQDVWMSHGDKVTTAPEGFSIIAHTPSAPIAAMADNTRKFYGVQFHPEVTHSKQGTHMLSQFVHAICGCENLWTSANIIEESIAEIKAKVKDEHVILGLSGGVDSSVVAALLHKAIGSQLTCIFVDNGYLRLNEAEQVMTTFAEHMAVNVIKIDAQDRFQAVLKGIADPEEKRKRAGREFIAVFDEESKKIKDAKWLAQGTIYPDVIE